MQKKLKKIVLCLLVMSMVISVIPVGVQAGERKKVKASSIGGKEYILADISAITFKGEKVIIQGSFYDKNWNESTKVKATYKVGDTLKYYEVEDAIYYIGKVKKSKFKKQCNIYLKDRFPMVHVWVKNGKIVAYATSA